MDRTLSLMLAFFGGGIGCLIRYLTTPDPGYPFMPANIAACLLIGIVYGLTRYKVFTNPYAQSFVTIGLLGGLSTFTPLATYALVQSETNILLSFLWFTGYLLIFFAISVVGYWCTATYCKKVLHLQAIPSIAALIRSHHQQAAAQSAKADQEQYAKIYAEMLKELLVAKDMLAKLKEQVDILARFAATNPQAAKEYEKAHAEYLKMQALLQEKQDYLAQLDPFQNTAPKDLTPAPGFKKTNNSDAVEAKYAEAKLEQKEKLEAQTEQKAATESEHPTDTDVTSQASTVPAKQALAKSAKSHKKKKK